ncbi:MAG: M1 family metallopeptidase [Minisyncoccia bacterium]
MKDNKKLLLIGALIVIIVVIVYVLPVKQEKITSYNINAKYNDENKTISAIQTVEYVNKSEKTLKEIYFHLYPNAFKEKEKLPFTKEELSFAYPEGFKEGYIDIKRVTFDKNIPAVYSVEENKQEILKIQLPKELRKGEKIKIEFEYKVQLPPAVGRFGYGKNTIQIANWYPIVSVFDKNGWNNDPYYTLGDPFYSEISNYNVRLTVPKQMVVASTGIIKKQKEYKEDKIIEIDAPNVRDFAIVMSPKFKMVQDNVDGIEVRSYYFSEEGGNKALKFAIDAIKFYNDYIGKYPYKQFSVVESDFYIGGMEYPNIVMISKSLYTKSNLFNLEYVIAHETAHQWWYGVVGNNQIKEAWLDEGLTEYTTIMYIERYYGKATAEEIYRHVIAGEFDKYIKTSNDVSMNKTLADFNGWEDYTNITYNKGAMFFNNLKSLIGEREFKKSLQTYYEKFKYKNATTQDLIDVVDAITKKDTGGFFQEWIY